VRLGGLEDLMKVFVTGASGWIGSAVVPELLAAGHQVIGLARTADSAKRLEQAGAVAHRGDVTDPGGLAKAAANSEGVIHLAFQHDLAFSGNFAAAASADRAAVEAMGAALAGSDRPFVVASGVFGLTPGSPTTENDGMVPSPQVLTNPMARRRATALLTQSLFGIGVRSVVVRLAPTVHGQGDNGFMATLVKTARQKGSSAYVGEGGNRWPAVHRSDAARLVRLGLERASPGAVLHAVGEEGVTFREIATCIGKHLGVPTVSITPEATSGQFGHLGPLVGLDGPASSSITRQLLGWNPTGPGLISDLDQGHYFRD
jgi:nucleoside-diphosphate-sugar epimerase